MAEVQFSGIGVVDMNGSVGGTTFARNYYGAYAKMRIGAPAGSAFLTAWQNEVASLAAIWEFGMSDSDRQTWYRVQRTSVDSMADKNVITGYDLYMSVNLNLFMCGNPQVISPPLSTERPQVEQPFFSNTSAGSLKIRNNSPVNIGCLFYATKPLPVGRMSTNQIYAFCGLVAIFNTAFDITTIYTNRLGAPVVGSKIFIKAVPVGVFSVLRGQPKYASCIVT